MRRVSGWFFLFLCLGCKPPPEISPTKYAPDSNSSIWINTKKEDRKLRTIPLNDLPNLQSEKDPLNLLQLFQIGLANNPSTSKTFYDSQIAAAAYGASRSSLYPDLNLDVGYLRQRQGFVFIDNSLDVIYTTTIGPEVVLTYNVIDFTRSPNIDKYFFELLSKNWTHNQEIQTVLKDVANIYYNYLYEKSLLEAFESDLVDAQATYESSLEKFQLGINDLTELMQAKSQYLQKRINVTAQNANVKNAFVNLNTTLGLPGQSSLEVLGFPDPNTIQKTMVKPEELLAIAQEARPDLKSLKANILETKASIRQAQGKNYPKLDFKGAAGQFWYNGGVTDHGNWILQFGLTLPIFTGYEITNEVREKQATLKQIESSLTQLQLQVISEVMVAYNNLISAQEQLRFTQEYLDAAKIDYKGAFEGYSTGTKDILYVLNAQASLSDARSKQAGAIRSYFDAKANLTFAIGTMNKNEAP
ncbi:MAG: TolC family protein [Chlamydiia bacterium]